MAAARTHTRDFFRIWTFFACLSLAPVLLLSFRALWASVVCFALPAIWSIGADRSGLVLPRWPSPLPLAAFALWVLATCLWSPSSRAVNDSVELVLLLGCAAAMMRASPPPAWMLGLGILGSVAVLTADIASGNQLRQWIPPSQSLTKDAIASARGLGLVLIMLPPALLFMHRSGRGGGRWRGVVALSALSASLSGILSYAVVILAGLFGMIAGSLRPRFTLRVLAGLWAGVMTLPFGLAIFLPDVERIGQIVGLPDSALHRLVIWRSVLDLWLGGSWLTGAGARATHTLTDRLGEISLASGTELPLVSAHPHNIPIQLLYEFGLVGYLLAGATLALGARVLMVRVWRRDMVAAIAATLAGIAVLVSVETDFWHLYFWCAAVLSALAFRAVAGRERP